MSFSSLHWDILISSFQKIWLPSSNYPPWNTIEVWNCTNMENTLKIKVFKSQYCFANIYVKKPCIFMKFYMVDNYYFMNLSFKFHKDPIFRSGDICKIKRGFFWATTSKITIQYRKPRNTVFLCSLAVLW